MKITNRELNARVQELIHKGYKLMTGGNNADELENVQEYAHSVGIYGWNASYNVDHTNKVICVWAYRGITKATQKLAEARCGLTISY